MKSDSKFYSVLQMLVTFLWASPMEKNSYYIA